MTSGCERERIVTSTTNEGMSAVLDEIGRLTPLHGPWRSVVLEQSGSMATIRIEPSDPDQKRPSNGMNGPWVAGLRVMRQARVHIVAEKADVDACSYVFTLMKGVCYLGRIVRMVTIGPNDLVVLEAVEDSFYDLEREPHANEIHEVPRNGIPATDIGRLMTCVGDRVRIIHPDDPTSPVVLVNASTSELRRMSHV